MSVEKNLLDTLKAYNKSTTTFKLKDAKGNLHTIKEGITGEIVEVKATSLDAEKADEILTHVFGHNKRIGVSQLTDLQDMVNGVKELVKANVSASARKKIEEALG